MYQKLEINLNKAEQCLKLFSFKVPAVQPPGIPRSRPSLLWALLPWLLGKNVAKNGKSKTEKRNNSVAIPNLRMVSQFNFKEHIYRIK
jgi:hypothetical protein